MKRDLLVLLLLVLLASPLSAGDLDRIGTTSGVQLLVPVGARSIALGGGSLADVRGTEAIYWNPAGVAYSPRAEVLFNNMQYIADIDLNYLGAVLNTGSGGSFAFHIKSFDFGDIEQTTEEEPDGTGITYSPTFVVTGLTYSRLLTDRISAGITGKVIYESILQTQGTALAIDLGVQYSFGNNLRVGVVMKNVGTKMQYNGRNLEQQYQIQGGSLISDDGFFRGVALQSDIPSLFSFGASYTVNLNEENGMLLTGAFSNYNDASDQVFGGIEYNFRSLFFLRGGYNYEAQASSDQIFGASFGAGLRYPVGSFHFSFDYAFRQLTDYFDSNNVFSIKLDF